MSQKCDIVADQNDRKKYKSKYFFASKKQLVPRNIFQFRVNNFFSFQITTGFTQSTFNKLNIQNIFQFDEFWIRAKIMMLLIVYFLFYRFGNILIYNCMKQFCYELNVLTNPLDHPILFIYQCTFNQYHFINNTISIDKALILKQDHRIQITLYWDVKSFHWNNDLLSAVTFDYSFATTDKKFWEGKHFFVVLCFFDGQGL